MEPPIDRQPAVSLRQPGQRIFGLDVLRAIAALSVMTYHGLFLIEASFPFVKHLLLISGVDLAFAMSGYLIGLLLFRAYDRPEGLTLANARQFLSRRYVRTLPPYYTVIAAWLLFSVVLSPHRQIAIARIDWREVLPYLVFCQNLYGRMSTFFIASWTLATEEWFYLLLAVWLLLCSRMTRTARLPTASPRQAAFRQRLPLLLVVSVIIAVIWGRSTRVGEVVTIDDWHFSVYNILVHRLDGPMVGVLAAYASRYYPDYWYRWRWRAFGMGLLLIGFNYGYRRWAGLEVVTDYLVTGYFTVAVTGAACLLPVVTTWVKAPTKGPGLYLGRAAGQVARLSYSIYLVHMFLVLGKVSRLRHEYAHTYLPPGLPLHDAAYFGLYAGLSFVAATILYKTVDDPIRRWRDSRDKTRQPARLSATA